VVGHVGLTLDELPEKPRVCRPPITIFGWLLDVVDEPFQFRRREVRIDSESGRLGHVVVELLVLLQAQTPVGGSSVLPDDGVVEWFAVGIPA